MSHTVFNWGARGTSRSTRQEIKHLVNARSYISSISLLIVTNDREDGKPEMVVMSCYSTAALHHAVTDR